MENPYQSPETASTVQASSEYNLLSVAKIQRSIQICILIYLLVVISQFMIPSNLAPFLGIGAMVVAIFGAVCVFRLAIQTYGMALGIILGIFSLIPLIGLFILLMVNSKATQILKKHGIKVGLLGANPADIPKA